MSRQVIRSSNSQAFLRHIRDNKDDPVPRLVYADWLEEKGLPQLAGMMRRSIRVGSRHDPIHRYTYSLGGFSLPISQYPDGDDVLFFATDDERQVRWKPDDHHQAGREGLTLHPWVKDDFSRIENEKGLEEQGYLPKRIV